MITIYSKPNCVFCTRAKTLLKSRDIPFQEKVLDEDFTLEEFKESFPGVRTFPYIKLYDRTIGGYVELVEAVAQDPYFGKMIINEGD